MNYTTDGDSLLEKLFIIFENSELELKAGMIVTIATGIVFTATGEIVLGFWSFLVGVWVFNSMIKEHTHELYKEYVQACIIQRKRMIHEEAEQQGLETKHKYALAALEELREVVDE